MKKYTVNKTFSQETARTDPGQWHMLVTAHRTDSLSIGEHLKPTEHISRAEEWKLRFLVWGHLKSQEQESLMEFEQEVITRHIFECVCVCVVEDFWRLKHKHKTHFGIEPQTWGLS